MERKYLSFDLEVKVDDDTRMIEGWASIFNNVDAGNDIVMPGAFAKTLAKRKAADKVVLLWQHDTKEPIGVWHDLQEIDKGLYGKAEVFDTARGADAYKLLKGGAVKGLSIGYTIQLSQIDQKKGTRKLTELELYEVSLVTFPMNDKAQVTRVKSEDGALMTERDFEEFLRDVGRLSQKEAKLVVSEGYKALLKHRDGGADELSTLAALFQQFKV